MKNELSLFLDLVSIVFIRKNFKNKRISALFEAVGFETFTHVMRVFQNMSVDFPSFGEWERSAKLALVYYYKEIRGMDWADVERVLPFPIGVAQYRERIRRLKEELRVDLADIAKEVKENEKAL